MATYYTGSDNQRDTAPMIYLRESTVPGSYLEGSVLPGNTMLYMSSGSYSDAFFGNSQLKNNCTEIPAVEASASTSQQQGILSNLGDHGFGAWRDDRNEMLAMQPMTGASGVIHNGQRLSLSLGTHIPSGIQIPYRNTDFGFSGGNQDSNKGELSAYGMLTMARTIPNSKYLKAAQQLLDEVVNVQKALKQPDGGKKRNSQENRVKSSDEDGGSKNVPATQQESSMNPPKELSHAERQELQSKLTKLLSMLDEVDRRYKQYYHQMQIVVSSFDVVAGCGAAKPYTALALQTISCHFRCLRDAINGQIQATRTSLSEQDTSENSKDMRITRLRYVDQQLRQQRALQQLGMMQQHAWRPQRGLPESSVSILRAWLFEHFLHPYPKDSDKILLARQTGLTRSQVSNWFINARVRLWKPMVEEMYKEEFADAEMNSNSSSDNAVKATKGDTMTSKDRGEDLQQSGGSSAIERHSNGHLMDSKSDNVHDVGISGSTPGASFLNVTCGEAETEYVLQKPREEHRLTMGNSNIPDESVHLDGGSHQFMAATAYNVSELGRFGSGSGVSLTLGLQHYEDGSISMTDGSHHQNFIAMRGDEMYNQITTSVGAETADFECINPGNRQQGFSSSQMLRDFVE
ncbi:BEL1-like homeodomain protein 7 [Hibiscus syriacus]|uniref:BEL1-like homeodomain protein 7 n=1 Tax=Hibiscus syriacus TaxID=106335 RepID=A0A6A3A6B4_HIBSY|nr:BEL1-like homeodomain protein 6 [Hibiscus syriacus]XP_039006917.1 BEL1-like homeodomain protein 6 [Hibiscus syriacus]XP_039006918.1 BEL1-like homeodomain protein 6 [Hibiscus syriacus]KAE8698669.1 BEL1-like homeodomain protein 7 [Hibiscus syriacus]